jgi:hypothetical protein
VLARERNGARAAGEAGHLGHLGHGADARVPALVHGHEQDALVVADVEAQGDGHVREDDVVVQWNQQQFAQVQSFRRSSRVDSSFNE